MKSGGYLALINPCSSSSNGGGGGGLIGPNSSSSDLESSVKEHSGSVVADDETLTDDDDNDVDVEVESNADKKSSSSPLKRSLTLHERIRSKNSFKNLHCCLIS